MNSTQLLARRANDLRVSAPLQWAAFVEAFDLYATEVTVAVTQAEQNSILNLQGRAQAFIHLLKTFRECHIVTPPKPESS